MKSIVNERFTPRKPIDTEKLVVWCFVIPVICIAGWSLTFWIGRWAWNHSEIILSWVGL